MLFQKGDDARRVLAQHHHVRPGQLPGGVGGEPVRRAHGLRLVMGGLGAHRPHHLKVLKAPEGHGQRAADEAQAHY